MYGEIKLSPTCKNVQFIIDEVRNRTLSVTNLTQRGMWLHTLRCQDCSNYYRKVIEAMLAEKKGIKG